MNVAILRHKTNTSKTCSFKIKNYRRIISMYLKALKVQNNLFQVSLRRKYHKMEIPKYKYIKTEHSTWATVPNYFPPLVGTTPLSIYLCSVILKMHNWATTQTQIKVFHSFIAFWDAYFVIITNYLICTDRTLMTHTHTHTQASQDIESPWSLSVFTQEHHWAGTLNYSKHVLHSSVGPLCAGERLLFEWLM